MYPKRFVEDVFSKITLLLPKGGPNWLHRPINQLMLRTILEINSSPQRGFNMRPKLIPKSFPKLSFRQAFDRTSTYVNMLIYEGCPCLNEVHHCWLQKYLRNVVKHQSKSWYCIRVWQYSHKCLLATSCDGFSMKPNCNPKPLPKIVWVA